MEKSYKYPKNRLKLRSKIIGIIAEAEYYSGFNRAEIALRTANGIIRLIHNNYRRRKS